MSVKGQVAEASYFVPFLPKESPVLMPTHIMDDFRGQLRNRGLQMYGTPVIETQRELFEHGDNVRISCFVRKL